MAQEPETWTYQEQDLMTEGQVRHQKFYRDRILQAILKLENNSNIFSVQGDLHHVKTSVTVLLLHPGAVEEGGFVVAVD